MQGRYSSGNESHLCQQHGYQLLRAAHRGGKASRTRVAVKKYCRGCDSTHSSLTAGSTTSKAQKCQWGNRNIWWFIYLFLSLALICCPLSLQLLHFPTPVGKLRGSLPTPAVAYCGVWCALAPAAWQKTLCKHCCLCKALTPTDGTSLRTAFVLLSWRILTSFSAVLELGCCSKSWLNSPQRGMPHVSGALIERTALLRARDHQTRLPDSFWTSHGPQLLPLVRHSAMAGCWRDIPFPQRELLPAPTPI